MKKRLIYLIAIISIFVITGCDNSGTSNELIQVTFGDLNLTLPSQFNKDDANSDENSLFHDYTSEDMKNGCMIHLFKSEYISDDLNKTIKEGLLNSDNFNYTTKDINGKNWSVGSVIQSEKQKNYYYAINYNNNLYKISYDDFGSGDLCEKYLNDIETSLKLD